MADKMAARTWFIMEVVCINVEILFLVYSAYNCLVFITNYIITFGIIQYFKKFKMAAKMAAENEVCSENDIYLDKKCLYIVFNVDSVEVYSSSVAVKCNEWKHTDLIRTF